MIGWGTTTDPHGASVKQGDRISQALADDLLLGRQEHGANGDDTYLKVVQRFGDTTDDSAQLRALAHRDSVQRPTG